jgi:thioredoxin 1
VEVTAQNFDSVVGGADLAQPGALPDSSLEDLISQAREVDMEQVRAGIAAKHAGAQAGA